MKIASVVKTFAIQKGTNKHNINDVGGREIVHSKHKFIIAHLRYTPIQLSHVRGSQSNCQVSGTCERENRHNNFSPTTQK